MAANCGAAGANTIGNSAQRGSSDPVEGDGLKNSQQPMVLLAAAKRWPLAARLASALRRHGCRVSVVCPSGHPLRHVAGIETIFPYRGTDSLASLKRALIESRPQVVVPCDDGVVRQLHELHRDEPGLRELIERSLGPAQTFSTVSSRQALLDTAAELGIRTPKSRRIAAAGDLQAWYSSPAASGVLKLDGTCGGMGVRIAHSHEQAQAAWRELTKARGAAYAWKRWVIDRDPLALWNHRTREAPVVTIQEYIDGRPANTMLVCWRGELLSLVSVAVVCSEGPTGAATVVRRIDNKEIEQAGRLLAKRLELTGFYGLDFVLEQSSGAAYLVEMNPRCTQVGHLELPLQGSLAGVFSAALQHQALSRPRHAIHAEVIALFPQAQAQDPNSPYLRVGYHDVPWEEPRLVRELLSHPWPERQWASRIYHRLRPLRQWETALFEEVEPSSGPESLSPQ